MLIDCVNTPVDAFNKENVLVGAFPEYCIRRNFIDTFSCLAAELQNHQTVWSVQQAGDLTPPAAATAAHQLLCSSGQWSVDSRA